MEDRISSTTLRKLTWRIVWFSTLLYGISYIDRVNIGFAALQMNAELRLTPMQFGMAALVFGVAYIALEIPSSLLLYRYGARTWIARILITRGVVSAGCCLVHTPTQLYVARFLLGAAEAGFYPGIVYYIAQWIPKAERGRAMARLVTAGPLAIVLGAPLSGALMSSLDGVGGIVAWRWLFFIEGLPALAAGVAVWLLMVDRPDQAAWLSREEKATLTSILAREHHANIRENRSGFWQMLKNPMVVLFALLSFCSNSQAISYWLPQIVKAMGQLSNMEVGLITALPYLCAFLFMRFPGRWSDRTGDRHAALIFCYGAAGVGLLLSAFFGPVPALIGMSIAATAFWSVGGPFNAMVTSMLTGVAAAGGTAFINSVAQIGGTVLPYGVGWLTSITHDFKAGLLMLSAMPLVGVALVLLLKSMHRREAQRAGKQLQPCFGPDGSPLSTPATAVGGNLCQRER